MSTPVPLAPDLAARLGVRRALRRLLFADAVGTALPVTVLRNGAMVDVIVTPTELTG